MYDRILVPLDGSALAEAAIPFAELIPSRAVRLLRVEPDAARAGSERDSAAGDDLARLARGLERQGREVELIVESGDPAARIVAAAAEADLVVMATRGKSGSERMLVGSVADHVARHAPAPTLLVRGAIAQPAPALGRVVVALDGSARSEAALPVAARLAGLLGVRPHLVRVAEASPGSAGGEAASEAAAYLAEQARRLGSHDLLATTAVLTGPPAEALIAAIDPTDLTVLATRGHGGLRRALLGSVAERLVREAAGPVLLVR